MDRTTSVVQTSIGLEGNSAGKNERIYSVGRESEFCKSRYDWRVFTNTRVYFCEVDKEG